MFLQGIQELLLNSRSQEKLQTLIESFQSDTFLNALQPTDIHRRSLYTLAQQCGLTQIFNSNAVENSAESCDPNTDITINSNGEPTDLIGKVGKKPTATAKSRASNTTIDLSCLSSAHLLAVLCMLSYAHKHNGNISESVHDVSLINGEDSNSAFADHMLKFDAGMLTISLNALFMYLFLCTGGCGFSEGVCIPRCVIHLFFGVAIFPGTQLAYACSDAATAAEKEPHRQYTFAILVFELLLALPYLPHRRGYWYKRLCIDYSHLQLHRCALRACLRCLGDSCVNVSISPSHL